MSRLIRGICCASALAVMMVSLSRPVAAITDWQLGYLFIGVGNATFQVRNNAGVSPTTIAAGTSGVTGGCALDGSLNVYLVNNTQNQIIKRALETGHGVLDTISTNSNPNSNPQSVVVAANGNIIVGHKGGLIQVYSNAGGSPLSELQVDTVDTSDSFWFDLAADQNTLFYTSGGRTIRTTLLNGTGVATTFKTLTGNLPNDKLGAIRLLAPRSDPPSQSVSGNDFTLGIRGVIVADNQDIKRLDKSGNIVKTYDANSGGNLNSWVALGLDPKDVDEFGADRAFWAGDFASGKVFRFNVETAAVEVGPVTTGVTNALSGICLNGEPTVGQFTGILKFNSTKLSDTTLFATGTPELEGQHSFGVAYANPPGVVNIAVNAREVDSNGVCVPNTNDVDCGFVTYFSSDPQLPKGAAYAHGRSVFYRVIPSQGNLAQVVITITTNRKLSDLLTAAGNCDLDPGPPVLPTGRSFRILRDPVDTAEDQFQFDVLESFFIDELGGRTKLNRFMAALRCSEGFSVIQSPADGRTFRAGNSISIQMFIADASGIPVDTATTAPHHMVATVGSPGQVRFVLGTPGSSPDFFKSTGNGTYKANLQTKGLPASSSPYVFCVTDSIDIDTTTQPSPPPPPPLYPQQCFSFFLK